MSVAVRFAPSPTGPLHIGGVRTALYNYLFAKKHGGRFILRIEDTDQNRFVPGAEQYIIESLNWCGIHWDEGPDKGGPHSPYRQSERSEIYREYALQLIGQGHAYYAFDTPSELEAMRRKLEADKSANPQYDSHTRLQMRNSLTMTDAGVREQLHAGTPYVIRIKTPAEDREVLVNDLIRGEIRVSSGLLDDKVLYKSDGMPTYHLANVADDHLMRITHVIRGEEWLPSAPLHVLLYQYLGWEASMPAFAHLPLLLKPDGPGKLSKRDGDRLGFPVFPLQWKDPVSGETAPGYREEGYFAGAFVNMLALLGWNPGDEQEIFSMEELIRSFSLDRVGKSGSRFDPEKARWFNHQYLQNKPIDELAALFNDILRARGIEAPEEKVKNVIALVRERAHFVHELWDQSAFFFEAPEGYDEQFVKKKWKAGTPSTLRQVAEKLKTVSSFDKDSIEAVLELVMKESGTGPGQIMPVLRLAMVGEGKGPDVKDIMTLLGREEVVRRLEKAIRAIPAKA